MKLWYALQCRKDRDTECALSSRGYDVYMPLAFTDRRRLTIHATVEHHTEPLFPGYLFFQMSEGVDDFHPVSECPGVTRIVKMTVRDDGLKYPTVIPSEIIDILKDHEDEQGIRLYHKTDYEQGDEVRVTSGPFKDCMAEVSTLTKNQRIKVLIGIMNSIREIEVDYMSITPV